MLRGYKHLIFKYRVLNEFGWSDVIPFEIDQKFSQLRMK